MSIFYLFSSVIRASLLVNIFDIIFLLFRYCTGIQSHKKHSLLLSMIMINSIFDFSVVPISLVLVFATTIISLFVSHQIQKSWKLNFSKRWRKEDDFCISNKLAPELRGHSRDMKKSNLIKTTSCFMKNNNDKVYLRFEELAARFKEKKKSQSSTVLRENSLISRKISRDLKTLTDAPTLDMDYIHISFSQYLWGCFFIIPNTVLLWFSKLPFMFLRRWIVQFLNCRSLIQHHIIENTLAELVLETFLVIGFM